MMVACCCSLAGTAACQHCHNNPMATDVWTNKTVTVDHIEAKPFGNGIDVCPVCGKPFTIGKPKINSDRLKSMSDEEFATAICEHDGCPFKETEDNECRKHHYDCKAYWLDWLRQEVE